VLFAFVQHDEMEGDREYHDHGDQKPDEPKQQREILADLLVFEKVRQLGTDGLHRFVGLEDDGYNEARLGGEVWSRGGQ
jgi:hypothetical protein